MLRGWRLAAAEQKSRATGTTFYGGSGWIRTTEVVDNRFTVCPLWPLGNAPLCNCNGCRLREKVELVDGLEPPTC